MLVHYRATSLEGLRFEDIAYIRHPLQSAIDLENTAIPNRRINEWDLPSGHCSFVNLHKPLYLQSPYRAYSEVLMEIKSGTIILIKDKTAGIEILGVRTFSGDLCTDLPLRLSSRLRYLISHHATRSVYHVKKSAHSTPKTPATTTINSRAAGRLLAAGGVYNGNIEGFRKTAEQLGGNAIEGYEQVFNETSSGMMIAVASVLVIRNPLAVEELTNYLGKYKKSHVMLEDINVTRLDYLRREREEYLALRKQFNNTVRPNFLKSLSGHPDALSTFDANDLFRLAKGNVPVGWQVHHKIPLDDGGTNAFDNLILLQNSPYHSALSKAQAIITKDLPYNGSREVLWPSPKGVIYPSGK
ncbi:HNH endonuclease [Pluralibacter gergoviae]